jgi:ADP-ribose pyrophosphatase
MPKSPKWKVLSSRDVLDARPFLKVRVQTIELPDGRRIPDYYQLEMPSFACIFAETIEGLIVVYRQYRHGRAGWA